MVEKTPEERRGHDSPNQRPPEYREASRKATRNWRERAKKLGLCQDCRGQAIPNQTRCEACAEKHRAAARRKNDGARRGKKSEAGSAGGGTR